MSLVTKNLKLHFLKNIYSVDCKKSSRALNLFCYSDSYITTLHKHSVFKNIKEVIGNKTFYLGINMP